MNTDTLEELDKVILILQEARRFRTYTNVSPMRPVVDVIIDALLILANAIEENQVNLRKDRQRLNPLWSFPDARQELIKHLELEMGHRPSFKELENAKRSPAVDSLNKDLIIKFPQFREIDTPDGVAILIRHLIGCFVRAKEGRWSSFMELFQAPQHPVIQTGRIQQFRKRGTKESFFYHQRHRIGKSGRP